MLSNSGHTLIGSLSITTRTNWEALDSMVKRLYCDYLAKLEQSWRDENENEDELDEEIEETRRQEANLGLDLDSIHMYYVGDMARQTVHSSSQYFLENDQEVRRDKLPDLLPYGYLVGDHTTIIIKLKGTIRLFSTDLLLNKINKIK